MKSKPRNLERQILNQVDMLEIICLVHEDKEELEEVFLVILEAKK